MKDLIGKSVVIGITCVSEQGREIDRFQTYGVIEIADETWIGVRRPGMSELFGLPPSPEIFEPAAEGPYLLEASGEQVENPDFSVSTKVTIADPESLLTIRGLGFVPGAP